MECLTQKESYELNDSVVNGTIYMKILQNFQLLLLGSSSYSEYKDTVFFEVHTVILRIMGQQ